MMKRTVLKKIILPILTILVMGIFTACGTRDSGKVTTAGKEEIIEEFRAEDEARAEAEANAATSGTDYTIYIIEDMDTEAETLTLYSTATAMVMRYPYSLSTQFLDKYGEHKSWTNFTPGQAVVIGEILPESQTLSYVRMAESVFVMEEISKYNLDISKGMLDVAGEKYHVGAWTLVFSGDQLSSLSNIGDEDILRIVGKDKDILSIAVTTGHGYIQFVNTSLFDDSIIQIGNKIFVMASEGLRVEVPEGEYSVTAANKGYGSTRSVNVVRNETALIDMEEMKGEGPKYCRLTFTSNAFDAKIYLDNELMEQGQTKEIAYGPHNLRVEATGYESWNKVLYVNSPEANISLNLTADDGTSSETSGNSGTAGSSTGNTTSGNTQTDSSSSGTTGSTSSSSRQTLSDQAQAEVDYITTMSNVLTNILSD